MINILFRDTDICALQHDRIYHHHPRVRRKMDALYFKSQEMAHKDICKMLDISKPTLVSYLKEYRDGGLERLREIKFYRPKSALEGHEALIAYHFENHPPATLSKARHDIEKLTGICLSTSQIGKFLERLGMKRRKTGSIPGKALDDDKIKEQETFKKQELEPRLAEAEAGRRAVFFTDAAHFVHGAFLATIWCFVRLFIPTPSGRKRVNVLGALNAVTHELITVTNDTYINSDSVCQLLRKIAAMNLSVPITLIMDNARYQRCLIVRELAKSLSIELLFLPSYSPNLNLIERFWKFVKNQCLYSKYYPTFGEFKTAILDCVHNANKEHKEKLDSLLTLNFQSFGKVNIMNQ